MTTIVSRPDCDHIPVINRVSAGNELDAAGYAVIKNVLTPCQCASISALYEEDAPFRNRIDMKRYSFGLGEYKYFARPLPKLVADMRRDFYVPLAQIANRWNDDLGIEERYPDNHDEFLRRCHVAGQTKPTPLLLRYGAGDYNCLHQDLYGDQVFPLQVAILLSSPGSDFTGGEFVLTEQRPRMQSRVNVVPLEQGDGVIFPVRHRPVKGTRGYYRANIRHGVSRLHTGRRYTLGVIFHDAK